MNQRTPNIVVCKPRHRRCALRVVAVVLALLVNIPVSLANAVAGGGPVIDGVTGKAKPGKVRQDETSAALAFLRKQIGPIGLIDSFPDDGRDHSYTYDNAMAALAFLSLGDTTNAEKILDAYLAISPDASGGFLHRYNAVTGKSPSGKLRIGHNAYLLQAMNLYYRQTKKGRYNQTAVDIADFMLRHQDIDGGLTGGPGVLWKSTENNAGAYMAIYNLGVVQGISSYRAAANLIRDFLIRDCWQREYFDVGKDDPTIATDVQALGALVLGSGYAAGAYWIEDQTLSTQKLKRRGRVTGFDLNEDQDTVWAEGTLQLTLTYAVAGDTERHARFLAEAQKMQQPSGGVLEASNIGTTGFGESFEPRVAVAPTAWYVLAAERNNVFAPLP